MTSNPGEMRSSLAMFLAMSSRLDIAMTWRGLGQWKLGIRSLGEAAHESIPWDIWSSGRVYTWNFCCNGRLFLHVCLAQSTALQVRFYIGYCRNRNRP